MRNTRGKQESRSFVRANHKIKAVKVRCILPNGDMAGVLPTREAMKLAREAEMDLVEVSPNAEPPVCRIMDFGKFRYEEGRKEKLARKNTHHNTVKEVKFRANTAEHDYQTKLNHLKSFLDKGHKVKVSLQFRGRENAHKELGMQLVQRVLRDCDGLCVVDMQPKMVGRSVLAMLGSLSSK